MREHGGFGRSHFVIVAWVGDEELVFHVATHTESKAKSVAIERYVAAYLETNPDVVHTKVNYNTCSEMKASMVRDTLERVLKENKEHATS